MHITVHTYILFIHILTAILGSLGISTASTALAAAPDLPFPFDLLDDGLLAAPVAAYKDSC